MTAGGLAFAGGAGLMMRLLHSPAREAGAAGPGWILAGNRTREGLTSLIAVDLSTGAGAELPVDCFAHGIVGDPRRRHRVVLFPQHGARAVEVDLRGPSAVRRIAASRSRLFYGHGDYSRDARTLFTVEADDASGEGAVLVRDADTLEVVDTMNTYGAGPHDCRVVSEGKVLAVANAGFVKGRDGSVSATTASSVVYIDLATGKLLDRIVADQNNVRAGHLDFGAAGLLAVTFTPQDETSPGPVMLAERERLVPLPGSSGADSPLRGLALSLKLHRATGILGVTSPEGGIVSFWNTGSRSLARLHRMHRPTGIDLTIDQRFFVVNSNGQTVFIDATTLDIVAAAFPAVGRVGNGAHLRIWDPGINLSS